MNQSLVPATRFRGKDGTKMNAAQIFLEIFLTQYFIVLVKQFMTSSPSSFSQYEDANISKTKKGNPKRKKPLFLILKRLSNKKQSFFTA